MLLLKLFFLIFVHTPHGKGITLRLKTHIEKTFRDFMSHYKKIMLVYQRVVHLPPYQKHLIGNAILGEKVVSMYKTVSFYLVGLGICIIYERSQHKQTFLFDNKLKINFCTRMIIISSNIISTYVLASSRSQNGCIRLLFN